MLGQNSAHAGPVEQTLGPHRRKRKPVNCDECRRSKLRCDRQYPCSACKRRGREASCSYEAVSASSVSTKRQQAPAHSHASAARSNPAESPPTPSRQIIDRTPTLQAEVRIPATAQVPPHTQWELEAVLERPAPGNEIQSTLSPLFIGRHMSLQETIDSLPPRPCCDYLVSQFFKNVSGFFPILHGPTFQRQYADFMQRPQDADLAWLALLFSICSLALNTIDENDQRLMNLWPQLISSPTQNGAKVSVSHWLLRTAMSCLLQDQFFVRHKFSTFEALLMVIYNFSHNESVDQGWALLGMALNIGIALRCNVDQNLGPIETERRRRCWAGLLTLHTYQGMIFRDFDMSYLLKIKASLPADVNDSDITNEGITQPSSRGDPTQMSVMMAKIRLFRLSTEICRHISGPTRLDRNALRDFDNAIADEQEKWDSAYMIDGSPRILDSTSFAYWCVLQTYAHHLYLLLHRPFHHSKAPLFLQSSRETCISSSVALISIHRQIYEAPLLQNYSWLLNGVTSLKALNAAVALNSCLLDLPPAVEQEGHDLNSFRDEIEKLVARMEDLSGRSYICSKAHRILRHLQYVTCRSEVVFGQLADLLYRAQSGFGDPPTRDCGNELQTVFEDWTDIREWMDIDWINYVCIHPRPLNLSLTPIGPGRIF